MGSADTAKLLAFIGGILSAVLGTIYLVVLGIVVPILWWTIFAGIGWIIYGILSIIFGALTLTIARDNLIEGELRTGAILCFVFGGVSVLAIGGVITIVAGILAILAWNDQRKAVKVRPPPEPEVKVAFCSSCGTQLPPEAAFCPSCGKEIKK